MAATDAQIVAGAAAALTSAGLSVGLYRQDPVEASEMPIALLLPLRGQSQKVGEPHRYDELVTLRVSLFAGSLSGSTSAEADLGATLEAMDETVRMALLANPQSWAAGVKQIAAVRAESSLASPDGSRLNIGRRLDFDVEISADYPDTYEEIAFSEVLLQVTAMRTPLPETPDAQELIEVPAP